jgi:quinol monooxygenase YgiN
VQVEEDGRMIEVIAECYCGARDGHGLRNAELIAHAPEDLEALIEEVKRLRMERTVARLAASVVAVAWKKARPKKLTMSEVFEDNGHMKLYGDVILWGITEGLIDPEGENLTFDVFVDVWEKHRTWFHKEWLDHSAAKKMNDPNALDKVLEFARKNLDVESLGS